MNTHIVMTRAADGDMRAGSVGLALRRARRAPTPWTTARQVHGSTVVVVDAPEGALAAEADALVTTAHGVPIAMLGADCALVAFTSKEGPIGIAHSGWKGLVDGVIDATVAALRALGASEISAHCSAMIHPECYEFSPDDLDLVAAKLGDGVRGLTKAGRPALDLPAGIFGALERVGVMDVRVLGGCTACEADWYSWRARRDEARHALVCWSSTDA